LALHLAAGDRVASVEIPPHWNLRLVVPAYSYPAGNGLLAWKQLIDSASRAPVVAIVNPDSGPGKRVDENYTALLRVAKGSKITLVGYVTLSYAKRPISAVKADVDSWLHFYPEIRGIFFDEQPSGPEGVAFAVECFAYARTKIEEPTLITNPGTRYVAAKGAPVVCLFEGEAGLAKYEPPDWGQGFSADRFVQLYGVKSADSMRQSLRDAIQKRAGYVYITDAGAAMPWNRLPAYWDKEIDAVRQANEASAPRQSR
jgi:hypothetical protein